MLERTVKMDLVLCLLMIKAFLIHSFHQVIYELLEIYRLLEFPFPLASFFPRILALTMVLFRCNQCMAVSSDNLFPAIVFRIVAFFSPILEPFPDFSDKEIFPVS